VVREVNMTRAVNLRSALLVAILLVAAVPRAYAIDAAISELRRRLDEGEDTLAVIAIAEQTISKGEKAIEELRKEVSNLQSQKAELQRIQTALTSGLIGALVTAAIAIIGAVFKAMSSKVHRDLRRLEVAEKLSELQSKGISIPADISKSYMASAPAAGSGAGK
jgi:hypothetical protein